MKLTAQVKLQPTPDQRVLLDRTLRAANAACTFASRVAWESKTFRQFALHKRVYREIRTRFHLSAQLAIRVIAKVADAYKAGRTGERTFRPRGSFPYDVRILSWKVAERTVSIWTLGGRQVIPFVCGERQQAWLDSQQGETDLVSRDGAFYLLATCVVAEVPAIRPTDVLGVDLGIRNLAVDSDGTRYSGAHILSLRHRHRRLRTKLQSQGTRAAKRRLRLRRRKERRFQADVNHCISKQLVASAQGTRRAIALEDLQGIRQRVSVRRAQRATLHSWAFGQLRAFVDYKARLAGVPVVLVDPRYTSQRCPACGYTARANRPSQSRFCCVACGFAGLADHLAAENIRRAAVNQPDVVRDDVQARLHGRTATERSSKLPAGAGSS
ncbi:MAG TPA: transposase [Candidatus Baltobacteraceae bacterium]|nr:transposase [Candidatus Baltobacteraceae bacterium]